MNIGDKIKQYRTKSNYSLQQLATLSNLSKATIQQYEDGAIKPSNKALIAVAEALNIDVWKLFHIEEANLELAEFRLGDKLIDSSAEKKMIYNLVVDYAENYLEVESILDAAVDFENPIDDFKIRNYQDVEKAASRVRKKWKLANAPIDDVTGLLENKGIKLINFKRQTESPGLCGYMKSGERDIPLILINTDHEHIREITRKRFTLMHESAHLILSFDESVSKDLEEKLCNTFASAMLLPGETLVDYIGKNRTNISLEELKDLKETFGLSIQGIIYSAHRSGLITAQICKKWIDLYDQWYIEGKDFGTYKKSIEEPSRLNRLIARGYMEKRLSKEKVSELLDITVEEVDRRFGTNRFSLQ
ncbi:helix-turn-helix domain-containing protein [Pedobacter nototheniae]|uniref:helix-turn-helix domain-containing protein n=1 Tax=Pedobacter nototheniae TaxID=2488994 RepID=UPI00103B27CC|nr:XRE family transcriptional regulator [Pedobacter nototheniae]